MKGSEAVVELFKDLQAALAIVRTNAAKKLNLTLLKAEVEVELTIETSAVAGAKWDIGVSLDASATRKSSNVHLFSLTLEPKAETGSMGFDETQDLANAIFEVASLHKSIATLPANSFNVGGLKLSVTFERTTEGKLQIVGGGGRSSGNLQRVHLTFRPSNA
jgi:hypothetical protein